jgi:RNA recognition motif-containing protein
MSSNVSPSCRLYVGNIDFEMNKDDVRAFFGDAGNVIDVYFPRDENKRKPHRGYIFVEMENADQALTAIQDFHGQKDPYGRELIVRVADIRKKD